VVADLHLSEPLSSHQTRAPPVPLA
jgi:hypothetical protein